MDGAAPTYPLTLEHLAFGMFRLESPLWWDDATAILNWRSGGNRDRRDLFMARARFVLATPADTLRRLAAG